MRWTERQRAMLREMGVQLWAPRAGAGRGELEVEAADDGATTARVGAAGRAPVATRARGGARRRAERRRCADVGVPGLAPADWLVVGEPLDPADPQQEQLLDNLLRAIGVARRAVDARAARRLLRARRATAPRGRRRDVRRALATRRAALRHRARPRRRVALLGSDAPLGAWRGRMPPSGRRGAGRGHLLARLPAAPSGREGQGLGRPAASPPARSSAAARRARSALDRPLPAAAASAWRARATVSWPARRVLGDRRAAADRRAGADLDRRDQHAVAADVRVGADRRAVLVGAVVVGGDRCRRRS